MSAAARVSKVLPGFGIVLPAGEDVVVGLQQLLVGEGTGVGGGELGQQAVQMRLVVHQHRLLSGVGGAELATLGRIGDRAMGLFSCFLAFYLLLVQLRIAEV